MPNWNDNELKGIKDFTVKYITALNKKDFHILRECFAEDAVLHRAMKNHIGRDAIIEWYESQLNAGHIQFELMDASACMLPDSSAKCILWFEIYAKGYGKEKKDIIIETIDLIKTDGIWEIRKCFAMGYNPDEHKKYFEKFL